MSDDTLREVIKDHIHGSWHEDVDSLFDRLTALEAEVEKLRTELKSCEKDSYANDAIMRAYEQLKKEEGIQ